MYICLTNVIFALQCQAIVVGFLGSLIAIVMGGIKSNDVELDHAYLLCASSLVTVSLASLVLGLITAGVIVLSRHCHINPDNVATPIAASLGDITSLALLSWVSTLLYESIGMECISLHFAYSELHVQNVIIMLIISCRHLLAIESTSMNRKLMAVHSGKFKTPNTLAVIQGDSCNTSFFYFFELELS